jgi:hypothetical protein
VKNPGTVNWSSFNRPDFSPADGSSRYDGVQLLESLPEREHMRSQDQTMNRTKAQEALFIAQEIAKHAKSAVDLHNAFFGVGGKFAALFPTRDEREAFAETPEYREILRLRALLGQWEKANREKAASC